MPNTALTNENLVEEIKLVLGGLSIEIELGDKDITLAARRTLRVYNRYLPFQGKARLMATSAQKKYRIDDLHPGLLGVVDVDFITDIIPPQAVDPFDPFYSVSAALAGPNSGDQTYADIMQQRTYAEDTQRIVSAEPEWYGQWERVRVSTGPDVYAQQYFLYVDLVRTTIMCSYTYNCAYQDSDDPGNGRPAIPEGDAQWFLDYTTALCKQTLARIIGKHGGIVGADGQTEPTDSADLRQEAATDLERLETEMKARKRIGIPITE